MCNDFMFQRFRVLELTGNSRGLVVLFFEFGMLTYRAFV